MYVMRAVVAGPPKRTTLASRAAHNSHYSLKFSRAFKGTMRKIPMIKRSDKEHSEHIENTGEN
jgi:hypothetical protein